MYSAVAFMSANLNPAAIANTPAKISLATRIAAVFMAHSLYFGADQPECRALGIDGVDGIFAARNFLRAEGDGTAIGANRFGRLVDIRHAEIIVTHRPLLAVHPVHDRADHLAMMVDEAIVARFAHRHGVALLPAELVDQEIERGRLVRSEERRVGNECGRTCRSRWSQYQ